MEPIWLDVSAFAIALFFMLVGLVGLIIPIFPGILIIWLAALGYGIASGFSNLGIVLFILITLAGIVGGVIDNILMGAGARKGGAAWSSVIIGMVAGVVGTIVVPPVGGLVAAPGAVLLAEYYGKKDWEKAWRATKGLALGWGFSFVIRFLIGLGMIGLFLVWAWQAA